MRRCGWMVMLVVGMVLASHAAARADIAMPRDQWTDIRMVTEHVGIVLGPGKVTVEATFVLKNEKGAVTAVVGYPRGVLEKSLDDFKVTVDGEAAAVDSQKNERSPVPRMGPAPEKSGGPVKRQYQFEGPYPEWKTFNVKFDGAQTRKVVVSYSVTPAEINTADNGKLLAYVYTLKTGATWKDNIERAGIDIRLNNLSLGDLVTVTPKPNVTNTDAAVAPLMWAFKDFKPTQDIEITFRAPK